MTNLTRFGNPGTLSRPNQSWTKANLATVRLPWPMVCAYTGKPVTQITFHRLGATALINALTSVYNAAEREVRNSTDYEDERLRLKKQHGFDHLSSYYDQLMAGWLHDESLKLIASVGGNLFGGSYVHRLIRGGNTLSTHAYGIALDIDPAHNPMGKPLRRRLPDWYVNAFTRHGFTWGGTFKSRPDPMHFELA